MSINEKKEFVCNICDRNDFKHNMALKAHERWHNSEYRNNISEKIKAIWQDPKSKYNFMYKSLDSENKIIKFNKHHQEYFEKYSKTHDYFDQRSIVKGYIKNEFNGNQIQPNIQVDIEQSFDILIKNNLEMEKIEFYTPPIYRRKRKQ